MRLLYWELRKLRAQLRVRLMVGVCAFAPPLLALVLDVQAGLPKDTLFGRHVLESGFALPLVVLGFAGTWAFPLLTSAVAGDIFAAEDAQGTWQSLLTRSRTRADVFRAKALASVIVAVLLLLLLTASSLTAGLALSGDRPLVGLSGNAITPGATLLLVIASWLSALPALLAFTAVAWSFSILSRNPLVGVGGPFLMGLLMQLLSLIGGLGRATNLLLTTPFSAWHGFLRDDAYLGPLWQGALVSLAWGLPCVVLARRALLSRDFT